MGEAEPVLPSLEAKAGGDSQSPGIKQSLLWQIRSTALVVAGAPDDARPAVLGRS
jgi:hypothetical protein